MYIITGVFLVVCVVTVCSTVLIKQIRHVVPIIAAILEIRHSTDLTRVSVKRSPRDREPGWSLRKLAPGKDCAMAASITMADGVSLL